MKSKTPVNFQSFIYDEDENRDQVKIPVEVHAIVTEESDMYQTKDSPSSVDVLLEDVVVTGHETYSTLDHQVVKPGEDVVSRLTPYNIDVLESLAIQENYYDEN